MEMESQYSLRARTKGVGGNKRREERNLGKGDKERVVLRGGGGGGEEVV